MLIDNMTLHSSSKLNLVKLLNFQTTVEKVREMAIVFETFK